MYNSVKGKRERIGRLLQMHSNERPEIKEVRAGDIAAAVGLKDVTTGDSLVDRTTSLPWSAWSFPSRSSRLRWSRKPRATRKRWASLCKNWRRKIRRSASAVTKSPGRPSSPVWANCTSTSSSIACAASSRSTQTSARRRVAYRETIRATVEQEGKFVRQSGGRGQYGHVCLRIEPLEAGKGYEFVNGIVGGVVPREYIPAVDKGVKEQMQNGVIAGYPVVDVKVTLYDGSYHDVDSSEMAFKIAGSMAFKEGARKAKPVLLEPIMKVEVVTPDDYMGDVNGDLNRRRGLLQGMDESRGRQDHPRRGAAVRDVWLRHGSALHEPGACDLFDGVWSLRGSTAQRRRIRNQTGRLMAWFSRSGSAANMTDSVGNRG